MISWWQGIVVGRVIATASVSSWRRGPAVGVVVGREVVLVGEPVVRGVAVYNRLGRVVSTRLSHGLGLSVRRLGLAVVIERWLVVGERVLVVLVKVVGVVILTGVVGSWVDGVDVATCLVTGGC